MRKTFVSLGSVLVALLFSANLAMAQGPRPESRPWRHFDNHPTPNAPMQMARDWLRHGLFGTVKTIGSNTFTVTSKQGDIVVTVTSNTKYHTLRKRTATFADLAVGDRVAAYGIPVSSGLTARQVEITPSKPTIEHLVGTVTAYSAGVSIAIKAVDGNNDTLALNGQTTIRSSKGNTVSVGDQVTVIVRLDPSTNTYVASAIVVQGS